MFKFDVEYILGALAQEKFLELIYSNNTVAECCSVLNINPAAVAFARRKDIQFDQAIRDAQAVLMDMAVDKLLTIDEAIENPLMARVISDNIKWLASKRAKEIYGDKVDVSITHTLDLRDVLADAKSRRLEFIDGNALELNDHTTDNKTVECVEVHSLDDLDVFA